MTTSDMAMHARIDQFWQGVDQRTEQDQASDDSHTDTPLFVWGIAGTPLALPQPHYRIFVPVPYKVTGWGLVGNAAGSAVVKVEHAPANVPPYGSTQPFTGFVKGYSGAPVFTSVTGGADPTLSGQQVVVTPRLTTWSPNKWRPFDLLHVYLYSTSGLEELSFQLFTRRIPRAGGASGTSGAFMATTGGALLTTTSGTQIVR
jgi:hypothetical protein